MSDATRREKSILGELFRANHEVLMRPSHAAAAICGFFFVCVLLAISTYTVSRHVTLTFVICFAALGLGMAMVAMQPCDVTIHASVVAFITLYQLYFYSAAEYMNVLELREDYDASVALLGGEVPWWTEIAVLGIVSMILGVEDMMLFYWRGAERFEAAPETVRDLSNVSCFSTKFGYVGGFLLLAGSFLPFPNCGLFYLSHAQQAAVMGIWILMALTEAHKKLRAQKVMVTPHIACKCAPLLYMHPYYWAVVVVFIIMNLIIVKFNGNNKHIVIQ